MTGAPANAASRPSAIHLRPGYIRIQGVATNGNGGRLKHRPLAVYIHSPGNRGVIAQVKTGRRGGFHVFVKRSKLRWYYSRNHNRVDLDMVARTHHGLLRAHAIKFGKSRRLVRVHFMPMPMIPSWNPAAGTAIPAAATVEPDAHYFHPRVMRVSNGQDQWTIWNFAHGRLSTITSGYGWNAGTFTISGKITVEGSKNAAKGGTLSGPLRHAFFLTRKLRVTNKKVCFRPLYGRLGYELGVYNMKRCTRETQARWANSKVHRAGIRWSGCYAGATVRRQRFNRNSTVTHWIKRAGSALTAEVGSGFAGWSLTVSTGWTGATEQEY